MSEVSLDSISLMIDESALFKGGPLVDFLNENLGKYRHFEVTQNELLSPRLWNLPEIFRKKIIAYSGNLQHEVNKQNRLADLVRYNFSNGMQISAKEILRHPLQRSVPLNLQPQGKLEGPSINPWPLSQYAENAFISEAQRELEAIMQALLEKITTAHRQKKIDLYLQSPYHPTRAMKISSVEFDAYQELDWRVILQEKKELESEVTLVSFRKKPLQFFASIALEPEEGVILVHPWLREFGQLQETLTEIDPNLTLSSREKPQIELHGEIALKKVLRSLRLRKIPVKIEGESRTLNPQQSQTEIHLDENGSFFIQHEARVLDQKNLVRKGWTTKSALFMQTLSRGLPFLLDSEAKDMATRIRTKREWDIKLLKHLGILQYIFVETLSVHFDGKLLDGTGVDETARPQLLTLIQEKIRNLLIAGSGSTFVRDLSLSELCSKPVLSCLEDFIKIIFKNARESESFYSERGEVILEGVVEREFRFLFEIMTKMALVTSGEVFKRSRTPLLSKISDADFENEPSLLEASFHFATGDSKVSSGLNQALESVQNLIPVGFKIFFKGQPLQELEEDEFHVDFVLKSETDERFFNWFELNPTFFLHGQEVDPDQILNLGRGGVIEYQGKLYLVPKKQIPSLKKLENFWQKLQKGKAEGGRKFGGDKIYQLPRHQTLELLALRASGINIRGDEEWKRLCAFYDSMGVKRDFTVPSSTLAELKPYQQTGVQWLQDLYNLRLGALLADDMGLGKTLQALTFLDSLREKNELGQVLIVVPSSLVFNWMSEVEKFTPQLQLMAFSSKDMERIARRLEAKEEFAVVTTYGLLMEHEAFLSQYNWKTLIFDEAQNLKNITTKRTSAARSLTAQFKICLTGTPMENHYGEFYSLVDLLVPGSLGKIDDFRRQFVNTEMVTREEIEDLKLKIKPLLLRRTKKEILDQLPEKQETKVSIAFEERQKEIYRDIALSYNQRVQESMAVQGEASVQLQMLTALLRLRQACSDPAALPNVKYEKVPPKLETLMDSLQEIVESGESALVFTQFLQTLEHTSEILKAAGIPVYVLHGGVPTKQRQKILADFNAQPGGAVLVMTLKTGGVGLNLTKASYVFHLEPWWNPSVENQATDRAHRIGQTKAVQVFKYIMHESLEEKIELLKGRKELKFKSLFAANESEQELDMGSSAISKQDFDFLLGIKSF